LISSERKKGGKSYIYIGGEGGGGGASGIHELAFRRGEGKLAQWKGGGEGKRLQRGQRDEVRWEG